MRYLWNNKDSNLRFQVKNLLGLVTKEVENERAENVSKDIYESITESGKTKCDIKVVIESNKAMIVMEKITTDVIIQNAKQVLKCVKWNLM